MNLILVHLKDPLVKRLVNFFLGAACRNVEMAKALKVATWKVLHKEYNTVLGSYILKELVCTSGKIVNGGNEPDSSLLGCISKLHDG